MSELREYLKDTLHLNLASVAKAMGFKHRNQLTYRLNGTVGWSKNEKEKLSRIIDRKVGDIPFPSEGG